MPADNSIQPDLTALRDDLAGLKRNVGAGGGRMVEITGRKIEEHPLIAVDGGRIGGRPMPRRTEIVRSRNSCGST